MKEFFTDNGVDTKEFNFKDRKAMLNKATELKLIKGSGFTGSGFKSLSSYPPHIIAGALHFVKQRKKLSTNQNEYNREQARNLLNRVLKK